MGSSLGASGITTKSDKSVYSGTISFPAKGKEVVLYSVLIFVLFCIHNYLVLQKGPRFFPSPYKDKVKEIVAGVLTVFCIPETFTSGIPRCDNSGPLLLL